MKILDLGCGGRKYKSKDPRDIVIGCDISKEGTEADVVHDLNKFPYPFKDNEFDLIICSDIMEHLADIPRVMKELWRILKPNGVLKIWTPPWNDVDSYTDPTHIHHFTLESFDYWDPSTSLGGFAIVTHHEARFKILKKKLIFGKYLRKTGIEWFANKYYHYYKLILCWVIPARQLYFELKADK